ncbi:MAG: iron-sulfur cluster assembly accessory protein [Bacteroidetes bacterium]|nr:MAG: iron-sulfur cluster assembly accessory protein [Bacteroidota bacterium]
MTPNPIQISKKAIQEIKEMIANKNIPQNYGLRVLAEGGGGCGGAKYRLGFDQIKQGDSTFEIEKITIIYEKKQFIFLLGLEIDFEERENEQGFVFKTSPIDS